MICCWFAKNIKQRNEIPANNLFVTDSTGFDRILFKWMNMAWEILILEIAQWTPMADMASDQVLNQEIAFRTTGNGYKRKYTHVNFVACMTTSWHGNIFGTTSHFWGESPNHPQSLWKAPVPPIKTKLTSWQFSFSIRKISQTVNNTQQNNHILGKIDCTVIL